MWYSLSLVLDVVVLNTGNELGIFQINKDILGKIYGMFVIL